MWAKHEDVGADLSSARRLHDPSGVSVAFELFDKKRIVVGKHVRGGQEVKQFVTLFLDRFLVSFDIFNHEIFPGKFVVIWKMIDKLKWFQSAL
jgi:hypothetical protein